MAEQTTVTGFFPVVKNSKANFASHPAKRRKLDASPFNVQPLKNTRVARVKCTNEEKPRKVTHSSKKSELSLSKLFTATPVENKSETTAISDDHCSLKRKGVSTTKTKFIQEPPHNSPDESKSSQLHTADEIFGKIKINPWISEQAKLVLAKGTSNSIIQASQSRKDKILSQPVKPSDVFKDDKMPKGREIQGNVREACKEKFQESIQRQKVVQGRGRLRDKYSHLLSDKDNGNSRSFASSQDDKQSELLAISLENSRIPAHQRFKQLASKKSTPAFILPQKYKSLLETFRSVDSILFLLHRRSETCTFERLKTSVQSMLGKKFTEQHLGQLKTVFPHGFIFRIEKNLRDLNGMPSKPQLTIEANFEELTVSKNEEKKNINQKVLISRRNVFESSLTEITKSYHQKFLKKLNLKIKDDELPRWHPHFKLNDVPDIEAASIPRVSSSKQMMSAIDILTNGNCIPQVEKALKKVAKKSEEKQTSTPNEKLPDESSNAAHQITKKNEPDNSKTNGMLKDVSSALLARIRQKELKKAELTMLQDPEQEKRLAMINQLPGLIRTLKTYFTTEKKAAIPLEDCSKKFTESIGLSCSSGNIDEQIRLLHELVPEWLSIVTVRKCPYVKISKNSDVNEVLSRLKSIREKENKR